MCFYQKTKTKKLDLIWNGTIEWQKWNAKGIQIWPGLLFFTTSTFTLFTLPVLHNITGPLSGNFLIPAANNSFGDCATKSRHFVGFEPLSSQVLQKGRNKWKSHGDKSGLLGGRGRSSQTSSRRTSLVFREDVEESRPCLWLLMAGLCSFSGPQ